MMKLRFLLLQVEIDRSDSRSPSHVTRRADQGGHQIPNQATAVPGETVLNREEVVHLPINPDLKPKIPTPSPNRDVVNSDKEDTSRSKSALASGNSRQGRHEGHCSPNSKSQESLTPDTKEIVSHQNQPPPAQLAVGPTRSSKDKKEKGNKGHLTPDTKESVKPKTSTPRFPAPNLTPPFGNGPPSSDPSLIHDESSRNRISPGGSGAKGGGSQSPPNRDAKKHGTSSPKDKSRHHTPSPQGKQGTGNTAPKPPSPPQPPNRISPAQPGEGSGAKGGKRLPPLPRGASSPGAVVTNHSGSHPPQGQLEGNQKTPGDRNLNRQVPLLPPVVGPTRSRKPASTPRLPAPNLTPPFGNGQPGPSTEDSNDARGPPGSDRSLIHDGSSRNRKSPGVSGAKGGGTQSPPNRDAKKHGTSPPRDKSRHHTPSPQGKQGTGNTDPMPKRNSASTSNTVSCNSTNTAATTSKKSRSTSGAAGGKPADAANGAAGGKPADATNGAAGGKPADAANGKPADAANGAAGGKPADAANGAADGKPADAANGNPADKGQTGRRANFLHWIILASLASIGFAVYFKLKSSSRSRSRSSSRHSRKKSRSRPRPRSRSRQPKS
eukprot:GHVP01041334.1.p1 GENE.GHVP01041334.1~~GHVP01041334.1.p1  ORF type:complete len:607 (-),score=95.36 GHVP01041334.1:340-2160(-)